MTEMNFQIKLNCKEKWMSISKEVQVKKLERTMNKMKEMQSLFMQIANEMKKIGLKMF